MLKMEHVRGSSSRCLENVVIESFVTNCSTWEFWSCALHWDCFTFLKSATLTHRHCAARRQCFRRGEGHITEMLPSSARSGPRTHEGFMTMAEALALPGSEFAVIINTSRQWPPEQTGMPQALYNLVLLFLLYLSKCNSIHTTCMLIYIYIDFI